MGKNNNGQRLPIEYQTGDKQQGPVECLGMTFENDEARGEYFLKKLKEGLEELHYKLGGVKFTTVNEAVERMKSIEKWPMGDEVQLRKLAERMGEFGKRGNGEAGKR